MNLLNAILNGLAEVWAHKLRSFLSLLSVMLGVASLVVITGLIDGMFVSWKVSIAERGGLEKLAILNAEPPASQSYIASTSQGRTLEDAQRIAELSDLTTTISPEIDSKQNLTYSGREYNVRIQGVTNGILEINRYEIEDGRPFCMLDFQRCEHVIIIGTAVQRELFPNDEDPIGKLVGMGSLCYRVVGVLKNYESFSNGNNWLNYKNQIAFVPITTMQIVGPPRLTWLNLKAKDINRLADAVDQVSNILLLSHRNVLDFDVRTSEEMMQSYESTQRNFALVGAAIGTVSLLVGAIGIANLMLASINERIREIGIRKAIGAWNRDLFFQFLTESVIISSVGGLFGLATSVALIHFLKDALASWAPPVLSPGAMGIGFGFSVIVGLLAGLYPALRASRMDPIDALRHE